MDGSSRYFVEAIENVSDNLMLMGVQWHPELLPDHAPSQALFKRLIKAAMNTQP